MHHIRGSIRKFYAWFNVPVTWVHLVSCILPLCAIYVVHIFVWPRCPCFSDAPFTWCIVFLLLTMGHLFDVPHSWYINSSLLSCPRLFRYHLRGAFLWLSGIKLSFSLTFLVLRMWCIWILFHARVYFRCLIFVGHIWEFSIIFLCAHVILAWFIRYMMHDLTFIS